MIFFRYKVDVEFEIELGFAIVLCRVEVDNEIVFDGEYRVCLEVGIVVWVDLVYQRMILVVCDLD